VNEDLKGKTFPCPLCKASLEIKSSKHNLPYMVCNSCGVQMFVRYELGVKRLRDIITMRIW